MYLKAKEYLQQLQKADVIINQRIQEKADLWTRVTSIGSFDYSKDRVQTSSSGDASFVKVINRMLDLENEIDRLIDDYIDLKHKIIGEIHDLNYADQIKVLYKRYVLYEKFEQIAVDLSFSIRNVYFVHGNALQEFQRIHLQK